MKIDKFIFFSKLKLNKRGMTLIEILIVIGILSVIFSIIFVQLSKIKEKQSLNTGITSIIFALNKASSKTLASFESSEYGVHFLSNKVIIFKGKVFIENASDNEVIEILPPAYISNIELTGGLSDIYFNRLTNMPSVFGTISITTGLFLKIITISSTGAISVD